MRFTEMMDLAAHGPDTFIGKGPRYPWGGLYGGQIVAQSLRAAAATVDRALRIHSLHAYFIRPGDHTESIRFEVDRLRNGRSFATRAVVARQEAAILHMAASFQVERTDESPAAMRVVPAVPVVAPPRGTPPPAGDDSWSPMFHRCVVPSGPGRAQAWLRLAEDVGDDPLLHACALAYLSDDLPTDASASLYNPVPPGEAMWVGITLDHAIWFQRPGPPGWQWHDLHADGQSWPRGLSTGRIHAADGTHLATVAQELLLRRR